MKFFVYILLFLVTFSLRAQDSTMFDKATAHYAKQEYKAAIKDYKQIISGGKTSTAVYFNLANAHFKLGDLAWSIFYYNKALQLSPKDPDVKNNLALAKKKTIDAIKEKPKSGLTRFFNGIVSAFGYNTWAVLAILFSIVFLVFGVWYYFSSHTGKKRLYFTLGILALIFGIVSVLFAYKQHDLQKGRKFAIVFAQQAQVHAEPNSHSAQVFTLHEGTKVKILADFNGYAKIRLTDGKQGWIVEKAVKAL